ncbi:MAG TPA: squalene/phytoene synthase family protein [Chthoniobacterales bacterium]|nr:squalene/phytoene synthase family protein [Chthoniobacterales bacterium]
MNAAKITGESKSNLALAFVALGRERRQDITGFYAFCRVIDDIADSTELSGPEKARGLAAWRRWLRESDPDESSIAVDVRALIAKYSLTPAMLEEIIDGVEMDLDNVRYDTFEALRVYCYRVASAVGLVSIEIFGYRNPACREYAIQLGLALQVTNIIRDVGQDLSNGRIYLPQQDLARFDYSEADLRLRKQNEPFRRLMEFEAARAEEFFAKAADLLPREDRRSMVAAEIMRSVYQALLRRMKADGFRVFERDYRLSRLEKCGRVASQLFRVCLNARN